MEQCNKATQYTQMQHHCHRWYFAKTCEIHLSVLPTFYNHLTDQNGLLQWHCFHSQIQLSFKSLAGHKQSWPRCLKIPRRYLQFDHTCFLWHLFLFTITQSFFAVHSEILTASAGLTHFQAKCNNNLETATTHSSALTMQTQPSQNLQTKCVWHKICYTARVLWGPKWKAPCSRTECDNPRLTALMASLNKYKHKYKINHCLKWQRIIRREGVHSNLEVRSGKSIHNVAF